jgi:predicted DNA-binding transcriptional regulator YafY
MSLLERIYHFHEELINNRFPTAATLVEQFEISPATARRDIAYLRDRLLAPIAFDQVRNGFYYTENDFGLPFEKSPKILFLLGMLSKIAEEAGLGSLPEVQSLEKRLSELVLPEYNKLVDAIHCEWVEVESVQPAVFDEILEAVVKQKVLEISYKSAQAKTSERSLEPLRLISYQGRWYLMAFCRLRQDIRLFHIARIIAAKMTRTLFKRHSEDNFDSYLNSTFGIFKGKILYNATILFTSTAAELVRHQHWHKDQVVKSVNEGVLMNLPVSDDREIMMKILQYGSMARVIGPIELRQRIEKEIEKISRMYHDPEITS